MSIRESTTTFLDDSTLTILSSSLTSIREYEFCGLERWNGTVEWTTGVEYWTGLLECHAHSIGKIESAYD